MTDLLADLHDVDGWGSLTSHQQAVLFVVYQDHARAYEGARIANMVRVAADPYNEDQVCVYYQDGCYRYGLETYDGRSIWY